MSSKSNRSARSSRWSVLVQYKNGNTNQFYYPTRDKAREVARRERKLGRVARSIE